MVKITITAITSQKNSPLNRFSIKYGTKGYISFVLIGIALFAFLIASGFINSINPPYDGTKYILVTPTPDPTHQTLQLKTLEFISIKPTPIPSITTIPTDCSSSLNIQSSENRILYAFNPLSNASVGVGGKLKVWYTDEHALSIGKSGNGVTVTSSVLAPEHASPIVVGDTTFRDCSTTPGPACQPNQIPLPVFPALFLIDLTVNPNATPTNALSTTPIPVNEVYGEWKEYAVAIDPKLPNPNGLNLGAGADPFPSKPTNPDPQAGTELEYGAEMIWNVSSLGLTPNNPPHNYLGVFVMHDGDANGGKSDIGVGCTTISF